MPNTWRTMAGVKEYTVAAGTTIGNKVDNCSRLTYAIGRRGDRAAEEWVPELDRAGDVITEWNRHGFEEALAGIRLDAGMMTEASDGSRFPNRGFETLLPPNGQPSRKRVAIAADEDEPS